MACREEDGHHIWGKGEGATRNEDHAATQDAGNFAVAKTEPGCLREVKGKTLPDWEVDPMDLCHGQMRKGGEETPVKGPAICSPPNSPQCQGSRPNRFLGGVAKRRWGSDRHRAWARLSGGGPSA